MHAERRLLKVAWLAPYDLRLVAHRIEGLEGPFHNAPWITNGARALVETGEVDLHVVTYHRPLSRDHCFVENGVTFHVLRTPLPWVPRAVSLYQLDRRPFLRTLRAIQPDLVHGHGTENIFSYIAVAAGLPNVISMQAVMAELVRTHTTFSRLWWHHSIVRAIEAYTLRRASRVFVEAPFVEPLIRRINPNLSVPLAGNIVSQPFFDVQRAEGAAHTKIMFVGRLTQTKGVEEIVDAFHRIGESNPALTLHLVGQGDAGYMQSRLRPRIDAGPAARRIIMRGHLTAEEIAAEYVDAAMVVLPTYFDTSPNVIAEAMVAGVPVVATAVGGLPYMLDEGRLGQLVAARDADALAEAIRFNVHNPEAAAARADQARPIARLRYGRELFASRMLECYRSIVQTA
jgi:glycosyltransferase involved in cell wall biosynthesis